jgi:hypothetical protein
MIILLVIAIVSISIVVLTLIVALFPILVTILVALVLRFFIGHRSIIFTLVAITLSSFVVLVVLVVLIIFIIFVVPVCVDEVERPSSNSYSSIFSRSNCVAVGVDYKLPHFSSVTFNSLSFTAFSHFAILLITMIKYRRLNLDDNVLQPSAAGEVYESKLVKHLAGRE